MLEHLAKAYLVGFHPTLVLEKNFDFPTLLRLAGQGQRVKPGHILKTIGLRVALERIGEMEAGGTPGAGKKGPSRSANPRHRGSRSAGCVARVPVSAAHRG
ncbi:MAG: hypothetical protein JWR70_705 [Modestobacter sp.]|jgi:hypothetical protein|nr:hypothetical protein [Modestobacter sp.]